MNEFQKLVEIFNDRLIQQSPSLSLQIALSEAERIRNLLKDVHQNLFIKFDIYQAKYSKADTNWYQEGNYYVWEGDLYDTGTGTSQIEALVFPSININSGKAGIRYIFADILVENPNNIQDINYQVVNFEDLNNLKFKVLLEQRWIFEEVNKIQVGVVVFPSSSNTSIKIKVANIVVLYTIL